ncbi:transposase, partial [Candidatus Poribacteria bacterium]|nr:transposase [Candidatus Poribacteria bacterium]
ELPYHSQRPVVCLDERPCQLIGDVIAPLPMQPGRPQREDYEYQRNGTGALFIAFEPLAGKRMVPVRSHRTRIDYAQFMKELANNPYPDAETIVLIQDHLSMHSAGSFYEATKTRFYVK